MLLPSPTHFITTIQSDSSVAECVADLSYPIFLCLSSVIRICFVNEKDRNAWVQMDFFQPETIAQEVDYETEIGYSTSHRLCSWCLGYLYDDVWLWLCLYVCPATWAAEAWQHGAKPLLVLGKHARQTKTWALRCAALESVEGRRVMLRGIVFQILIEAAVAKTPQPHQPCPWCRSQAHRRQWSRQERHHLLCGKFLRRSQSSSNFEKPLVERVSFQTITQANLIWFEFHRYSSPFWKDICWSRSTSWIPEMPEALTDRKTRA